MKIELECGDIFVTETPLQMQNLSEDGLKEVMQMVKEIYENTYFNIPRRHNNAKI